MSLNDVVTKESRLRELLRHVRLVADVELFDGPFSTAKSVMFDGIGRGWQRRVGEVLPAATAIYLVGEGIRNPDGRYWTGLSLPWVDPQALGPQFLVALDRLGLDDFLWAIGPTRARYVASIRYHGNLRIGSSGDGSSPSEVRRPTWAAA